MVLVWSWTLPPTWRWDCLLSFASWLIWKGVAPPTCHLVCSALDNNPCLPLIQRLWWCDASKSGGVFGCRVFLLTHELFMSLWCFVIWCYSSQYSCRSGQISPLLSSHGLIHSPGPRAHCFIQGHPMCSTALQDVEQNNRRTVCVCLDCPAYCPASVLQARPSHECVLLLRRPSVGAHTTPPPPLSGLQEQATCMAGVLLRRSGILHSGAPSIGRPPTPRNSGNLRPHSTSSATANSAS